VIRIEIPPLRERPGDLPLLVQHFLAKHGRNATRKMRSVAPAALEAMLAYSWPGNVRELESAIESAYALGRGDELALEDLPRQIVEPRAPPPPPEAHGAPLALPASGAAAAAPPASVFGAANAGAAIFKLDELEKDALLRALQAAHGNKSKAADLLGVSRKRLYRMLHDYGMESKDGGEDL